MPGLDTCGTSNVLNARESKHRKATQVLSGGKNDEHIAHCQVEPRNGHGVLVWPAPLPSNSPVPAKKKHGAKTVPAMPDNSSSPNCFLHHLRTPANFGKQSISYRLPRSVLHRSDKPNPDKEVSFPKNLTTVAGSEHLPLHA